jgi:hypothetical protein
LNKISIKFRVSEHLYNFKYTVFTAKLAPKTRQPIIRFLTVYNLAKPLFTILDKQIYKTNKRVTERGLASDRIPTCIFFAEVRRRMRGGKIRHRRAKRNRPRAKVV